MPYKMKFISNASYQHTFCGELALNVGGFWHVDDDEVISKIGIHLY